MRLVRPSQDGERGERLTNTPFGAKDGGHRHQERALAITGLRRTRRRCALATPIWYLVQKHVSVLLFGAKRRISKRSKYFARGAVSICNRPVIVLSVLYIPCRPIFNDRAFSVEDSFWGRQRVARFRMSKGSGRRAASRLFK